MQPNILTRSRVYPIWISDGKETLEHAYYRLIKARLKDDLKKFLVHTEEKGTATVYYISLGYVIIDDGIKSEIHGPSYIKGT